MDALSTYTWLGIPDSVAAALVLVTLSLALAPWFSGAELGPLKFPKLGPRQSRLLKYVGPVAFLTAMAAFFPTWSNLKESPIPENSASINNKNVIEVVNESSQVVVNIYINVSHYQNWEEDSLGNEVINKFESAQVEVFNPDGSCFVDVRAVLDNGKEVVFDGYDVCENPKVIIPSNI